jgi:hypothetical protein
MLGLYPGMFASRALEYHHTEVVLVMMMLMVWTWLIVCWQTMLEL